jgi:hypothetical protein
MIGYKSMKGSKMPRSLVNEFLTRHPSVDGYTLICVCEEINRRTKAAIGVDGILTQALHLPRAEKFLVSMCAAFQPQKENA